MKRIAQALAVTTTMLLPALALACPGVRQSACTGQLFDHAGTLGAGIVAGALSVLIERAIRNRKG
jgi:hypothetical protein